MFIGHYGPAYALKSWQPRISLFLLFIAVQVVDVAWAVLVLLGIEKVRIVPGITATNPLDLYYMPYTHSLFAALLWSIAGGVAYALAKGRPQRWLLAIAVGAAILSHWVLDFVVHRPDLPLYDNARKVGLGLWNFPAIAFALEAGLLLAGLAIYLKGSTASGRVGLSGPWVFAVVLLAVQGMIFFGNPPDTAKETAVTALVSYFLIGAIAAWIDRSRRPGSD